MQTVLMWQATNLKRVEGMVSPQRYCKLWNKENREWGSRIDRQSEEVSWYYYETSDVSFWSTDGSG